MHRRDGGRTTLPRMLNYADGRLNVNGRGREAILQGFVDLFAAVFGPIVAVDAKVEMILAVDRHDAGDEDRYIVEDTRHHGV